MSDKQEKPSLLSKTNPNATTRSVLIHSLLGACGGFGLWLVLFVSGKAPLWSIIPWVPFGAFVAGILEWQMDDPLDSEDEAEDAPRP